MTRQNRGILQLNNSYEILGYTSLSSAINKYLSGAARIHEALPDRWVQGPPPVDGNERLRIPYPVAIILKHYQHVSFDALAPMDDIMATRRAILQRDGFCCMYCAMPASTYDHIFPKSRGGEDTWLNLVAACVTCNGFKADRTPEEAGMTLVRQPFVPQLNKYAKQQKRIWKQLEGKRA